MKQFTATFQSKAVTQMDCFSSNKLLQYNFYITDNIKSRKD